MADPSSSDAAQGSAYGKLILFGEHAVVHGVPALVAGVGLQVRAHASVGGSERSLDLLGKRCVADPEGDELARAFAALLDEGGAPAGIALRVEGELPPGVGLGFSAAAAVAIARAVELSSGRQPSLEAVERRASAWEGVYHGNPSGVDVAAAMHGGFVRFVRGEGVTRVSARVPLSLCVGLTGTRSSTREMVEGVARLKQTKPEVFQQSLEGIRALVENAIGALEDGRVAHLGELMDLNQMLLAGWMLSTDRIEQLCSLARESGALGAKLTGAGGGGAVVALAGSGDDAAEVSQAVVAAWTKAGFKGFATSVGEPVKESA